MLVGGAEASQNGFGRLMPREVDRQISHRPFLLAEHAVDAARGALALGDGVDDLLAAVDAVAAGEVARVGGLHGERVVRPVGPPSSDDAGDGGEELDARASGRWQDDDVGGERSRSRRSASVRRPLASVLARARARGAQALDPAAPTTRDGLDAVEEADAVVPRELDLVRVGGHLLGARGGRRA